MAKKQIEREIIISSSLRGTLESGLKKLASALGITAKEQDRIAKSGTAMGRALRTAEAGVKTFGRGLTGVARALTSFKALVTGAVVALGGFLLLRRITSVFRETVAEVDKLAKTALRLGESVEFISRLGFAAQQAGVGFDQAAKAAQDMTRRLAEAVRLGKGEALPALKILGLMPRDLTEANGELKNTEKLLFLISDRLRDLSDADRLLVGAKLFGDEGLRIIQLLLGGPEGIRGAFAESDRFGATVTRRMAEAAVQITDAMQRLERAWFGLRVQVITGFAGPITDTINNAAAFVADLDDRAAKIAATFRRAFDPLADEATRKAAREQLDALAKLAAKAYADVAIDLIALIAHGLIDLARVVGRVFADTFGASIRDAVAPFVPGFDKTPAGRLTDVQQQIGQLHAERMAAELRVREAQRAARLPGLNAAEQRNRQFGVFSAESALQKILDQIAELEQQVPELQRLIESDLTASTADSAEAVSALIDGLRTRISRFQETTTADVSGIIAAVDALEAGTADAGDAAAEAEPKYGRLTSVLDRLRGTARSVASQLDKLAVAGLGLQARMLSALGQGDAASRANLTASQLQEIMQARSEGTSESGIAAIKGVQGLEMERLVFDQQRAASLNAVTQVQERYTRAVELNERKQNLGIISQRQAKEAVQEQQAALLAVTTAERDRLVTLSQHSQFAGELTDTIEDLTVKMLELEQALDTTFRGGFAQGMRDFGDQARDANDQGKQLAATLGGSATDSITNAIEGLVDGTKKWGQAWLEVFQQVLRDVGVLLVRFAVLRVVAGVFGAAGPEIAKLPIFGFNSGGYIPGGGPNRDSMLIGATPGEYVVRREAVDRYTPGFMQALNDMLIPPGVARAFASRSVPSVHHGAGFNDGGAVGGGSGGGVQVLPVMWADGPEVDRMVKGIRKPLVNLMGQHPGEFRSALGL